MSEAEPRRRPRTIGVVILVAIGLLALAIIASLSLDKGDTDPIEIEGAQEVQKRFGGIRQEGDSLGDEDAPVVVQVLNDMQCERCADFQRESIDPLVEPYVRTGDVRLEYHHYALGDRPVGVAYTVAESAGLQGYQWQYVDLFFINQDEAQGAISKEFVDQLAAATTPGAEFNIEQWQRDNESQEVEDLVMEDGDYTAELRLTADPAVIVESETQTKTLEDAPSLEEIEAAIEEVGG